MDEQPVQLRLGFLPPTRAQRLEITLSGMSVVASPDDLDHVTAAGYLSSVGIQPRMESNRGLVFPVRELPLLLDLPHRVDIVVRGDLKTLYELVQNLPDPGIPVLVTLDGPEDINLSWPAAGREFNEPLPLQCAPALASLPVALLATDETWATLSRAVQLPIVLGRAKVNVDGFVEVHSMSPARLEMAPVPALFKIDGTRFGVPLKYADTLAHIPGISWEGPVPTYDKARATEGNVPAILYDHVKADLGELTSELARTRGRVVAWSSGLGRRTFCLAALSSLEATPIVVVTRPAAVWVWRRTCEILDLPVSVGPGGDTEVSIITYQDADSLAHMPSPAGVIFDDLNVVATEAPSTLKALHRLDGVTDLYRVACCRSLPAEHDALTEMLSLVRPVEFKSGVPAIVRYPGDSQRRLSEHVACYTSTRTEGTRPDSEWARNRVEVVAQPDDHPRYEPAHQSGTTPLERARELASRGTDDRMGPKVSLALQEARSSKTHGRTLAVLTRFPATGALLAALLRPLVGEAAKVLVGENTWKECAGFDRVLVMDYPDRMSTLDAAVGTATEQAHQVVTVAHMTGSVDDRLVVAAHLMDQGFLTEATFTPYVLNTVHGSTLPRLGGIRMRSTDTY